MKKISNDIRCLERLFNFMTVVFYVGENPDEDMTLRERRTVVVFFLKSCQAAITLNGIQPLPVTVTVAAEQGMPPLGLGC